MSTIKNDGAELERLINQISKLKGANINANPINSIINLCKNTHNKKELLIILEKYEYHFLHSIEAANLHISPTTIILSTLYNILGGQSIAKDKWALCANYSRSILENPQDNPYIPHLIHFCCCQALASNQAHAFAETIDILLKRNTKHINMNELDHYASMLFLFGWRPENEEKLKSHIIKTIHDPRVDAPSLLNKYSILRFLGLYDFSRTIAHPSQEWLWFVFTKAALPLIDSALANQTPSIALYVELLCRISIMRSNESSEYYGRISRALNARMESGGALCQKILSLPTACFPTDAPPKVIFILSNPAMLAHTKVLLNVLEGFTQHASPLIKPYVVVMNAVDQDDATIKLHEKLKKFGVPYVRINSSDPFSAIMNLRQWCIEEEITAAVCVSTAVTMAFMYGLRIVPVQIYWSLKYHSDQFSAIDGYMTSGSFQTSRLIEGRSWRVAHSAVLGLFDPAKTTAALEIKKSISENGRFFILGCIGRPEKIDNDDFISALAEIMRRRPETLFLWTGRTQHEGVVQRLRRHGVAERCRYIGWVDTLLYAQVLDLFIDSFPFASGHTAMESMAAGVPVVLKITPEALESSIATHVVPAYRGDAGSIEEQREIQAIFTAADGSSLLPMVDSTAEFINIAVKLIGDTALRKKMGAAAQRFVRENLGDAARMAHEYCDHILEIIDDRRKAINRTHQ